MATPKYNRKVIPAYYDSDRNSSTEGKATPTYPWVTGSMDILGASHTVYADPDKYETSFTEDFSHSGAFSVQETSDDERKGLTNSFQHETRSYNSGGISSTSNGHKDTAGLDKKASERKNFAGDIGQSAGSDVYSGAGGRSMTGSQSGGYNNDQGDSYSTTTGNRISAHKGTTNSDHEGDYVDNTTGNRMSMVKGDRGWHIQSGNMDIQVDGGQVRIKAGQKVTIDSTTEIEIKVGSSSITITPSGINIVTSGTVVTNGTGGTKIQNGSISAPPTHFK